MTRQTQIAVHMACGGFAVFAGLWVLALAEGKPLTCFVLIGLLNFGVALWHLRKIQRLESENERERKRND